MIYFICGILCSTIIWLTASAIDAVMVRMNIQKIIKPNESVECYNATILIDEHDEISWVDNNKRITIWREK